MSEISLTRRQALGLGAGALVATVAGCGSSGRDDADANAPSTTSGASGAQAPSSAISARSGVNTDFQLPVTSVNTAVKYDIPATADGVLPAFLFKYPADPVQTVTEAPASGGKVTAACEINTPVPTSMGSNPVWKAINSALGTTLDITYTPGAGWPAKLQTLIASGDLPDLVELKPGVSNLPGVLEKLFVDLSPYIAGDKVAQYQNLAIQPQSGWKQTVFGGGIFGIPQTRPRPGGTPARTRSDIIQSLGVDPEPGDGAGLINLMKAVTDSRSNRWASSTPAGFVTMFTQMLGGPNVWAESGGKFISQYESSEMERALSQVAALWKSGVFHPDSFAAGVFPKSFDAGQTVLEYGGFDPGVRYLLNAPDNPNYRIGFLIAPKFDGGGASAGFLGTGFFGFTAISKRAEHRTDEILRVLNWCGAPQGSKEALLTKYGLEGRDYTLTDGMLTATTQAKSEVLILGYLSYAPAVYFPTDPAIVPVYRDMHTALVKQYAATTDNASIGLYSPTVFSPISVTANKALADLVNEVIQGRKDLASWRSGVAAWQKACGAKIASEYADALASASS